MSSRQRQLLAKEHLEEIPSENANASNHLSEDDASLEERSKNPYAILGLDPDSDSEPVRINISKARNFKTDAFRKMSFKKTSQFQVQKRLQNLN